MNIDITLKTFAVLLALLDNYKYILQTRKMIKCNTVIGISSMFLLISIFVRLCLFGYAIYYKDFVFVLIYVIGFFATLVCYISYINIKIKNRSIKK